MSTTWRSAHKVSYIKLLLKIDLRITVTKIKDINFSIKMCVTLICNIHNNIYKMLCMLNAKYVSTNIVSMLHFTIKWVK